MKIELKQIKFSEVYEGYLDSGDEGLVGFSGKLNIRPAFQREFVYKDKQRDAVINTVSAGFPLNVMYWSKLSDDSYELLDGQQRTVSLCQYRHNDFSMQKLFNKEDVYYTGLSEEEKKAIDDYELMIYICEGTEEEKLEWFKVINIAGAELTPQELRNAVYTGEWLSDAKRYFSKNGCAAYRMAKDYLNGEWNRQDYLQTAIKWKAQADSLKGDDIISLYMSKHRLDPDATELWNYFNSIIEWIKATFTNQKKDRLKIMKGIDWGYLYNTYHTNHYDPDLLEQEIKTLIEDEEVENKKGIYEYVLQINKELKKLNLRTFKPEVKLKVYNQQNGKCALCGKKCEITEMDGDHIIPWSKGGKTVIENCQMLCKSCNLSKSNK